MASYITIIYQSLDWSSFLGSVCGVLFATLALFTLGVLIAGIPNSSSRLYSKPLDSPSTCEYLAEMSGIPRASPTFSFPLYDASPVFVGLLL
jgi:hypothetical protein